MQEIGNAAILPLIDGILVFGMVLLSLYWLLRVLRPAHGRKNADHCGSCPQCPSVANRLHGKKE